MRIFISYNHKQGDWVWKRLVPSLRAGGAKEILIDRERFRFGLAVVGQMDNLQDQADKHLLVLSPDYFKSDYCLHEFKRAIKCDPKFTGSKVLPVLKDDCTLPKQLSGWNPPLWADMWDDNQVNVWKALFEECGATKLGSTAPAWLDARDEILSALHYDKSTNLVIQGDVNWRGLLDHITKDHIQDLVVINFEDPDTTSRQGLLNTIIRAIGENTQLQPKPHDLSDFKHRLIAKKKVKLAFTHFDLASHRSYYDKDLFGTLRFLMEQDILILLVHSKTDFKVLMSKLYPFYTFEIGKIKLSEQP